jgi:iron complex transport system permease protein
VRCCSFCCSKLTIGAVSVPLRAVLSSILTGESDRTTWTRIVLQFRLPRALNAIFSGAALGACGLLLQTLFRNPLADPYVLGVVHGSQLGAAVLVVLAGLVGQSYATGFGWLGDVSTAAAAATGAILTTVVIMAMAKRMSLVTLLIFGLMLGYLCSGLVSVVLHFTDETQAGAFRAWNDGAYSGINGRQLRLLIPLTTMGILMTLSSVKGLNALLLGEDYARSVGIDVGRARRWAFLCTAILSGTVTAFCGPIAFVGLVVAHLGRSLFQTSDHRLLMPACILMGSVMALSTDLVTHLPWAKHFLHLNAVNGVLGAPIVMWVIARQKNRRALEL